METEPVDFLIVTDRDSAATPDLYPARRAAAGQDCVSVPLTHAPAGHLNVIRRPPSDDLRVVWSGTLRFPSGHVVVSDQGMAPLAATRVAPGAYRVVIGSWASDPTGYSVSLVPSE